MMTPELYILLFAALGAYVVATVWHRTAEERRLRQLARADRDGRAAGAVPGESNGGTSQGVQQ